MKKTIPIGVVNVDGRLQRRCCIPRHVEWVDTSQSNNTTAEHFCPSQIQKAFVKIGVKKGRTF